MPRRGLRDLGGHPPPRNFQPHQPLNHCPHLQPPHQSQPEPSREPRRGPRDDFSVLGWVLCGHCFAVLVCTFRIRSKARKKTRGGPRSWNPSGRASLIVRTIGAREFPTYKIIIIHEEMRVLLTHAQL
ncbi:hypothetical protein WN55_02877 [Dufourea novaeangliae]|uniref:Uncharacterized protein n=1 Tax=Dufourea novaeangliae TaxID=178035 RepID=A0A154PIB1_DUFNO|nr:hypothetical protein WN55_02877 [Dufourea novaeangliae]